MPTNKSFVNEDEFPEDNLEYVNQVSSDNEVDPTASGVIINRDRCGDLNQNQAVTSSGGEKNKPENFKHQISNLTRTVNGKIISFLRKKLKNDDGKETIVQSPGDAEELEESDDVEDVEEVEEAEAENEDEEDDYDPEADDPDFYNVDQVSNYTDSDDEQEEDSYSIVSTPKPKLQPFYSQTYLDQINSGAGDFTFLLIDHTAINNNEQSENDEYFINLITKSLSCILINNLR
jgi:hypothetical protein